MSRDEPRTTVESVRKTSKVVVAHADILICGYGAEIAAGFELVMSRIWECPALFHVVILTLSETQGKNPRISLDTPVRRVAAMDTFVACQPLLEDAILPQPEDLYKAMLVLAKY